MGALFRLIICELFPCATLRILLRVEVYRWPQCYSICGWSRAITTLRTAALDSLPSSLFLLSSCIILWITVLSCGPKSPHYITKDTFIPLITLEIPRVLGALSQKQGQRPNTYFLLYITISHMHLNFLKLKPSSMLGNAVLGGISRTSAPWGLQVDSAACLPLGTSCRTSELWDAQQLLNLFVPRCPHLSVGVTVGTLLQV